MKIEEKEKLLEDFIASIDRAMTAMLVLSGVGTPETQNELAKFLKHQKTLYIKNQKDIEADL